MNALFAHRGKITTKVTKNGSPILGAKTARNLLTQFHHPKIGFRQIVIKRHRKIMQEPQNEVVIFMQTDQQIEGVAFLWGPRLPVRLVGGGLAAIPI